MGKIALTLLDYLRIPPLVALGEFNNNNNFSNVNNNGNTNNNNANNTNGVAPDFC